MRNKFLFQTIFLTVTLLGLNGCSLLRHYEQLMVLKNVGDSQREIESYLKTQAERFYQLRKDLHQGTLKIGLSKEELLTRYGEPVLSKKVEGNPQIQQIFIYRHPTNYFTSDKIYLYFDKNNKLVSFEYEPAP